MAEKGWISVFAYQDLSVDTAAIQNLAVTGGKIADTTIPAAKLTNTAALAGYYGITGMLYGDVYYG